MFRFSLALALSTLVLAGCGSGSPSPTAMDASFDLAPVDSPKLDLASSDPSPEVSESPRDAFEDRSLDTSPGCDSDSMCPSGHCDILRHLCVSCLSDDHCPAGALCSPSRLCVAGCTEGHGCAAGASCCVGLCVRTADDAMHCGACGRACSVPGASAACVAGACVISACNLGRGDCDGMPSNGCETELETSVTHCHRCGQRCIASAHASALCAAGSCTSMCDPGFADCDMNIVNGCESDLGSRDSCGACGIRCAGGTPLCSSMGAARCVSGCSEGETRCGMNCVNASRDLSHCGVCDNACPTRPNGAPSCAGGRCGLVCSDGLGDCDGDSANGCESTLNIVTRCGACSTVCAGGAQAIPVCSRGLCALACASGFADCDGDRATGCEVDLRSTMAHCGRCGVVCDSVSVCRSGVCALVPEGASCQGILRGRPSVSSGTYRVDPDSDGPLTTARVYCDMERDGGGWTLVEVALALGTNLYTREAVGAVTHPDQTSSAKLSRAFEGGLLRAGGRIMRMGEPEGYGELFLGPFSDSAIDLGLGAPSYGTVVSPNLVSLSVGGGTYPGSRLAWPLNGTPAACLNSNGSSAECSLARLSQKWVKMRSLDPHEWAST